MRLLGVKSPAPPVVALFGLLGIVIGEQGLPWVRGLIADRHAPASSTVAYAGRLVRKPAAYAGAGVLLLAGVLGIVLMPGPAVAAWSALAGFAGGMLLTLALVLPSLLGRLWGMSDLPALAFLPFAATALDVTLVALVDRTGQKRYM